LLHASLRNLIGFHVKQAGSLVAPDRLRFDFTHYAPLSPEELIEIENLVNSVVMQNSPVTTSVKDLNEAIEEGAMALFGEKYGSHVRVVAVDTFSKELCGGTHVQRTGDIGLFKVVNEGGIAAGIRRIEAITGEGALGRFREDERLISELEELARGKRSDLTGLVERYQSSIRTLEKELEEFRYRLAKSQVQQLLQSAQIVKGVKVVTGIVDGLDKGGLRNLADELKAQLGRGLVVLATSSNDKVSLVATVTPDLIQKVHAGKLVKEISAIVGGSGGGRAEMAEAGGRDPSRIAEALQGVAPFVSDALN
jgi:alanyl-tRNA synthetase